MEALLGSMLLLGLASGLHCVGMCGGAVLAFGRDPLAFNLGRIASYSLAGAAAGALGGVAQYAGLVLSAQAALFVLANLVLILVGLHIAGLGGVIRKTEILGVPLWKRMRPFVVRFSQSNSFLAGAAWGWIPCGLVYGALAAAVLAGGPREGAAAMAAFGLGTLPWLLAAGVAAARLRAFLARPAVRTAAGAAVLCFGVFGLARASGVAGAINQSLLCP
jgi:uncharacterized protein